MPREILEKLGTTLRGVVFGGAYYFHGTRVLDPGDFQWRGILPLDQMLDQIWVMLYQLVREEVTEKEWREFRGAIETDACGHDGFLYRLKTRDHPDSGPNALLVRETLVDPRATGSHDYLGCPEIVQDIARCCESTFGIDLEPRFCDVSKPCIVKFRSRHISAGAIMSALWYLYLKIRENKLSSYALYSFNGEGVGVSAIDIVSVEVVADK